MLRFDEAKRNMKKVIRKIVTWMNSNKLKFVISTVALSMAAGGGYLFAYAQQFMDTFLDTSRIADTWNVDVDTANGEVKLAQRSCDNTVWFCDLTNLCASSFNDGTRLLVKRANEAGTYQWKNSETACNTPECGIDGGQGDNFVVDNTINFNTLYYPAREACKAVGGRLPSPSELQCMWQYRTTLGNNFASNNWSSQERDTNYAYCTNSSYYGNFNPTYTTKTTSYSVRCVRSW